MALCRALHRLLCIGLKHWAFSTGALPPPRGGRHTPAPVPGRFEWRKIAMKDGKTTLPVNVIVDISPTALEKIVENVKKIAGPDKKGIYRVDTADKVGEMISRFLFEKDFERFVQDINNYRDKPDPAHSGPTPE
jgi:hypothetical protein